MRSGCRPKEYGFLTNLQTSITRILREITIYRSLIIREREVLVLTFLETYSMSLVDSRRTGGKIESVLAFTFAVHCIMERGNIFTGILHSLSVTPTDHVSPTAPFKPKLKFLLPLDNIHRDNIAYGL